MEKYRAGIIGCGSIANAHARGYLGVDEIELVAIADPVKVALDEFKERYNIQNCYDDAREMLDREELDIVSVATPHKQHAPMTITACSSKPQAVLCEKPMATNLGECDEMMIAAQRNNVKLAIGHQRRFLPAWTRARELIASGAIGEPRHIVAKGAQGLLNDCSHLLDMMRYMLSDPQPQWVMGNIERKTDRYERGIPIEDRSAGIVQFDDGAIGILFQELAQPYRQGGTFYGSEGILDLDERRVRLLSTNSQPFGWEEYSPEGENPHIAQARELVEWIEEKVEHRGDAKNGRAAVEIIMGIYESARLHEVVQMPVRTRCSPLEVMIETGALPVERPGAYDIRAFLLRGEEMKY
ncbi:TPA: Gfo/Idh/MocA family oxidoreductase [Candidatus Poribacteria bacterium]|nr:Gfo/Idh/MocA family oxidoreductase [Candidatus Poribacteria bacterium]